jgi:hypothetical protein
VYILQVLYIDVAKVYRDVAYVAIVIHICFKCFIYFQTYVSSVLSKCYKSRSECCICVKGDTRTLKYMFEMFICFRRMLQVFHMDVAKINLDATYVSDGACDPRGFIARVKGSGRRLPRKKAVVGSTRRGGKNGAATVRRGFICTRRVRLPYTAACVALASYTGAPERMKRR